MQAFVDRFRYKASKARQAQSRLKALANLQPIAEMVEDRVAPFIFPDPENPLAPPLIRFDRRRGLRRGRPVLRNIALRIDPDDRIALLGANGNGSLTLAKLLCGHLPDGRPDEAPPGLPGYFAQHQLDELSEDLSPYEYISALMPDATVSQRRAKSRRSIPDCLPWEPLPSQPDSSCARFPAAPGSSPWCSGGCRGSRCGSRIFPLPSARGAQGLRQCSPLSLQRARAPPRQFRR